MQQPPMIITDLSITIVLPSGPVTVDESHVNFELIREAIANQEWDSLDDLVNVATAVVLYSDGAYEITELGITYQGDPIPRPIETRVLDFMKKGLPFEYLLRFHERLMANPSRRALHELYDFLEHKHIPITPEGLFMAYKSVRPDLLDHHSGTILNEIGAVIEMPRNQVDDDKDSHCSHGLHAGAWDYAATFGGSGSRMLLVSVDPADVVSIPADHNCMKLRTCRYTVVAECERPVQEEIYGEWDADDWEDGDEDWDYYPEDTDDYLFDEPLEEEETEEIEESGVEDDFVDIWTLPSDGNEASDFDDDYFRGPPPVTFQRDDAPQEIIVDARTDLAERVAEALLDATRRQGQLDDPLLASRDGFLIGWALKQLESLMADVLEGEDIDMCESRLESAINLLEW